MPPQRLPADPSPEHDEPGDGAGDHHQDRREDGRTLQREREEPDREKDEPGRHQTGEKRSARAHEVSLLGGYPLPVDVENYSSGADVVLEFLELRFSFNAADFAQRVSAAAYSLGLVDDNELDEDETDDLVELAADGLIEEPRSELGRYLVRHWERLSLVDGESLVYWLRKLVFRGAWLDHRVKDGRLDVAWDDATSDFTYLEPGGARTLLELAPTPSWHELQFKR
jgi:hypothetical protein